MCFVLRHYLIASTSISPPFLCTIFSTQCVIWLIQSISCIDLTLYPNSSVGTEYLALLLTSMSLYVLCSKLSYPSYYRDRVIASSSEGPGFECRPRDRPCWLTFLVFFLSPSSRVPGYKVPVINESSTTP
jgi:hypothetical protein